MNIRSSLSILGLAAALGCGGGGGSSSSGYTPPPGPPANTVWVGGDSSYGGGTSFNPATLTVSAGTTVTFLWKGGTHNVTSYGSPSFTNSGDHSNVGDTYTYQFTSAGTYTYYCTYHGTTSGTGMAGQVVVN